MVIKIIQDKGPAYNLGFGVTTRDLGAAGNVDKQGPDPTSGILSKSLNDHPVLRFFAASAATVVGTAVASKNVRKGGIKLFAAIQHSGLADNTIKDIRGVRDILDDFQGVVRKEEAYLAENKGKLFWDDADGNIRYGSRMLSDGRLQTDELRTVRGWYESYEEAADARAHAADGAESVSTWALKDELKQRLVGQARRAPYELPAAYVAQRGITDRLFGTNSEDDDVNWANPLDVISDFTIQSAKNAAFMFSPLEVGQGAAVHGYRRAMTLGDDVANLTRSQRKIYQHTQGLQRALQDVGHDAAKITNEAVKYSSQVTGSFSTAVKTASEHQMGVVEMMNWYKHGTKAAVAQANYQGMTRAQIWKSKAGTFLNYDQSLGRLPTSPWDSLPGPFKGMHSGARAGAVRWTQIGEEHDAIRAMHRMGRTKFMSSASDEQKDALNRALTVGSSPVEELIGSVTNFSHGVPVMANGRPNPKFQNGQFYKNRKRDTFNRVVREELQDLGVDEDDFTKLSRIFRVAAPGKPQHMANRISLGGKSDVQTFEGLSDPNDLFNQVVAKVGSKNSKQLAKNLPEAIRRADARFKSSGYMGEFNKRTANEWKLFETESLPRLGEDVLGKTKMVYSDFADGNLTRSKRSFLARKTAEVSGLNMRDELGDAASDQAVQDHLRKIGMSPDNYGQMRAYLARHRALTNPWNKTGANLFGFSPVSLEDATDKGFFAGSGPDAERQIRGLASTMARRDPVSGLGTYKAGGLTESAHGELLDFNFMRRGIRSFTDKLADEFQIPLIHLPVLKTMGYSGFRNMREQSMIQYADGAGLQPFRGGGPEADFHMWTRASARGSKGRLAGFKWGDDGVLRENVLDGKYRAISTRGSTMEATQVKIAAGDLGRVPAQEYDPQGNPAPPTKKQTFKRWFNIDEHQPDSAFKFFRRFRDRKSDLRNPRTFAQLLSGHTIKDGKRQLELVDGSSPTHARVVDKTTGTVVHNARDIAEATDKFPDLFRGKGMPRKIEGEDGFVDTFTVDLDDAGKLGPNGPTRLVDMTSQAQEIEFAKRAAAQHTKNASAMDESKRLSLARAQELTINRHLKHEAGAAYWDANIPGSNGSIVTRQDQLRADLQQYLITAKGILSSGSGDPSRAIDGTMQDMVVQLGKLKSQGRLSQAQYIESRAALLGTQLDFSNLSTYKPMLPTGNNTHAARRAFQASPVAKDLLSDIVAGQHDVMQGGGWQGRFGKVQPFLKRQFGTAKYDFDGQEYDPFGNQSAFVPTFSTAFARNGWGALASVAGVNTWSSPDSFSGSSIMAGHLIERVNKTFGLAGLSLDPTKYKSPLDMYARGMIGQRALPIVALGTTAVALDRTAGGLVNEKDKDGNRVYSPLVLGAAATGVAYGQAGLAGILPGGKSYEEKRTEIMEGEVAIKAGRFWPLGNTPWEGGRTQYYRPSWYRRLKSGYSYTDDTHGSPLERLAFGYDFSPLRPLDPYRFERKHYEDRPYPTTGEYFTGPWGPMTSALNMTVGRVLKPQIKMHKDELESGLSQYLPTGQQGAFFAPPGTAGASAFVGATGGGAAPNTSLGTAQAMINKSNQSLAAAGSYAPMTGRNMAFSAISDFNQTLSNQAGTPWQGSYGPVSMPGQMTPRVIGGASPVSTRDLGYQMRQLGYEAQELAGIYGFATGAVREKLGFGNLDMTTPRPVLDSPGRAYGSTRGFWSLGLGGLGDIPSPLEGNLANIEISEIVRRFVPRERTGTQFVNPIKNRMGQEHGWLPSAESGYYLDFTRGDPFTKVSEGEMRLPGIGYERFNDLHSDRFGEYGLVDQHKILGDVAPWSQEYRALDRSIDSQVSDAAARERIETTRMQVADKSKEHNFKPYEHQYEIPTSLGESMERGWEKFTHLDTPFHTKFMQNRTAVEDWERNNVYGSTFPQWQNPIEDFFMPMLHKSTQRNPISAALVLGGTGTLFGKSARGKVIGATIGAGLGFASSVIGKGQEMISGKRYMPQYRREEVALEEYADILEYVKQTRLAGQARQMGDMTAAAEFTKRASTTMYGLDVYNAPLSQIAQAMPKRKREHFEAMMYAPVQEREQILSTAGRLERRALQAVWGQKVEARPELEEYFQDHELPDETSSFWHPNTNQDQVKIKVGQSMGLDMSQMGYYPQQVVEANMVNPAYPQFNYQERGGSVKNRLKQLMFDSGIDGDVTVSRTPYPGSKLQIDAGVY